MLKVLIVDDSEVSRNKALAALNAEFECLTTASGKEALVVVNEFEPDIMLLDINMPEMDGFETCKQLTTSPSGKKVLVVFVSSADDIETKIKAYDAGGHDFIAKPFSETELVKKIARIGTLVAERDDLLNSVEDTQSLAMTSMKQASHYGYIMNFFKNLYHSDSAKEVAKLFFEAMDYWNLKASLVLRLDQVFYFESATIDHVSPIERKIFVALQEAGRLYEFGQRMIVNDNHASFLIKNMPEDEVEAGEIRDVIAAIIEGLEAKAIDLKRKDGLDLVTVKLNDTISRVKNGVTTHNQLISAVITDMMGAVASSFHSLELTEDQESFFHDLFEKSGQRIMSVEKILLDIQEQLSLLSNHVNVIIEDTKDINETGNSSSEVEFF